MMEYRLTRPEARDTGRLGAVWAGASDWLEYLRFLMCVCVYVCMYVCVCARVERMYVRMVRPGICMNTRHWDNDGTETAKERNGLDFRYLAKIRFLCVNITY
jgi:hypothetical protein